jgi:K(+)-stimulated pyrophosphate-energized sodium pump
VNPLIKIINIVALLIVPLVMQVHGGPVASAPAAAPLAAADADAASFRVDNGVVKFYFATGKADLAAGSGTALAEVATAVAAGKRAVVSGYHDASGDPARNAELARLRAVAVRDALKAAGIAEDRIDLQKPEQTQAGGPAAEARRVEVVVR